VLQVLRAVGRGHAPRLPVPSRACASAAGRPGPFVRFDDARPQHVLGLPPARDDRDAGSEDVAMLAVVKRPDIS